MALPPECRAMLRKAASQAGGKVKDRAIALGAILFF
jgi:hypothetical protein